MMGSGRTWGELLYDLNEATRLQTTIPRSAYLITQFSVIATYLRMMLFPWGQNLDHDYPVYTSLLTPRPLWGLLLICGLLGLAVWAWRKARTRNQGPTAGADHSPFTIHYSLVSFGILWFFIALSVESSVIPIVDVIYEHRMYLPSVGLFLLAGVAAQQAAQRLSRRTFLLLGSMVVVTLTLLTLSRNRVWQSQVALWGDAVAKSPAKGRPHANLGKALHDAGRTQEALPHLRLGVQLEPANPTAHFNLGVLLDDMGHPALAIPAYQQALSLQPDFPDALGNLANDLIMTGRMEEAISGLESALALAPRNATLHNSMGVALLQTGSVDRAIRHLEEAVSLSPGYAKGHLNLGRAYGAVGRHEEAAQHLRTAATLAPEQRTPAP
jgi:Flp pilus assembly protein TadD